MHKRFLFILSILCVVQLQAQISVESCTVLDNDLDARNYPVLDDEGFACALVKIVTTAKGFNFEIGQLPVKKVDGSKVGEIWVYVPEGTMRMKITHPDLGSLHGADIENGYYFFPSRLKKSKVYRLELTHKEVVKVVGPQVPAKITFNCNVEGAEVVLGEGSDAKTLGVISNHQYSITWPKGQLIVFKIKKDKYEDYEGAYKVENDKNTIDIKMKPLFGFVTIKSLPNAIIKINGKDVGRGTYQGNLDNGSYTVQASLDGYHDANKSFTITSGDNKNIELKPDMIYGILKVSSNPSGASVYVDGIKKGVTPVTINGLVPGNHKIELRKNSFVNIIKNVNVIGNQTVSTDALFTTKQSIQALRDQTLKSHFYLNAGFMVGSIMAPTISFGFYVRQPLNLMIELGGFYGLNKSDLIYWYDANYDNIGNATYSPYGVYGYIGYVIKCSLKFNITPKLGFKYTGLKSNWNAINDSMDPSTGSYALTTAIGCDVSYTICPHLVISLSPEYGFSVKESSGFKEIKKSSSSVQKYSKGFNGKLSFNYYF